MKKLVIAFCCLVLFSCKKERQTEASNSSRLSESSISATNIVVSTYAGSGKQGSFNSTALKSQFNYPFGLDVSANGDLFVGEIGNGSIRKISSVSPEHMVSLVYCNLYNPQGIAVHGDGSIFIPGNNIISKLTPEGKLVLVAGSPTFEPGYQDRTGTEARFNIIGDIELAPNGDLYVSDGGNGKIRKISPEGVVSTVAGSTKGKKDGAALKAQFSFPDGLALGPDNSLYVTDRGNNNIRKIAPDGVVTTIGGNFEGFKDGKGILARFSDPNDVAINSEGYLFVSDNQNHAIRMIAPDGTVSTIAGNGKVGSNNGNGEQARFSYPRRLVFFNDELYVADWGNNKIRKISFQ